jgi:hypothetical protein
MAHRSPLDPVQKASIRVLQKRPMTYGKDSGTLQKNAQECLRIQCTTQADAEQVERALTAIIDRHDRTRVSISVIDSGKSPIVLAYETESSAYRPLKTAMALMQEHGIEYTGSKGMQR